MASQKAIDLMGQKARRLEPMENEPQQKPPLKRPLAAAFLLAVLGLLLLDGAVQLFVRRQAAGQRWILLVLSLAFLVLAGLLGSKRI